MKKYGIIVEPVKIDKLVPGGQALGTLESGQKVFFWNALPGETVVEAEVIKKKSHYLEAIAKKIANSAPFRVAPKDECFLSTSPWQIIDFNSELKFKRDLVIESFREAKLDFDEDLVEPCATDGREYHYRNKMEYSLYFDHADERIHLAFHRRGSHQKIPLEVELSELSTGSFDRAEEVLIGASASFEGSPSSRSADSEAPISSSSLERPEILHRALEIVESLNSEHADARKFQSLLLRANRDGEVSGGLYENNQPHPEFSPLTDEILGQKFTYSPNGFFQVNLPVYEMALREIRAEIESAPSAGSNHAPNSPKTISFESAPESPETASPKLTLKSQKPAAPKSVLDLYSGVGSIGLSVAKNSNLTLVECDNFAFSELQKNVKNAIFGNEAPDQSKTAHASPATASPKTSRCSASVHAVHSKSEDALEFIKSNQIVILDPPRAGCDNKLIAKLNSVRPAKIIYLSCNPSTQARDLKLLSENYQITKIHPFDFFPHTTHIENLVVLIRK